MRRVGQLRQIYGFFSLLLHTVDSKVIDIKVDCNAFKFFDSRWINKGQILLYLVIDFLFFNVLNCSS